ncbi:hypothetical protein L249_5417 [Ophiocordyceps polyrhachis-furcata BCC 54312]|uniref:Uncharacterized protein n=1 Tax=Ophiocordyceps polyrhachis-furcata BCC 54312 TaxID=1330021 RepID=A0A367L8Q7_9HYPO|nr:hypothetical protein L249_5417 [Ophiocordyceps polyrhachis-furcata BCC 54312]
MCSWGMFPCLAGMTGLAKRKRVDGALSARAAVMSVPELQSHASVHQASSLYRGEEFRKDAVVLACLRKLICATDVAAAGGDALERDSHCDCGSPPEGNSASMMGSVRKRALRAGSVFRNA